MSSGQNGFSRSSSKRAPMAIPYSDQVGLMDQCFEMMTARNLAEMKTALSHLQLMSQNIMVATVQGGTQALSRSLFASLVPTHKSGEFFGFYSVFEKFASIFGPLLFWITIATTGNSRNAILSVILFFVIGGIVLSRVRVSEGQQAARAADADLVSAPV